MSAFSEMAVKNVVLVHGGFVDGSGWEGVYRSLRRKGLRVTIVQNPTISLADDVAVTKRVIAVQLSLSVTLMAVPSSPKPAMIPRLSAWSTSQRSLRTQVNRCRR